LIFRSRVLSTKLTPGQMNGATGPNLLLET
jgi:hypothetical protein